MSRQATEAPEFTTPGLDIVSALVIDGRTYTTPMAARTAVAVTVVMENLPAEIKNPETYDSRPSLSTIIEALIVRPNLIAFARDEAERIVRDAVAAVRHS